MKHFQKTIEIYISEKRVQLDLHANFRAASM